MRSLSKLALLGLAALLVCAAVASSASAVTVGDSSGSALSVGDTISGSATGVALSGSFFFINRTTTCDSSFQGTVQANPNASGHAWGKITSLDFTNCKDYQGNNCTVSVHGLPWDPTSNGGGVEAVSKTSVRIGVGTPTSSNYIDVSNCVGGTCKLTGNTAGPLNEGSFSLSNYVGGSWSNAASNQLSINTGVGIISCTATSTNWTGAYHVDEDAGGTKATLN